VDSLRQVGVDDVIVLRLDVAPVGVADVLQRRVEAVVVLVDEDEARAGGDDDALMPGGGVGERDVRAVAADRRPDADARRVAVVGVAGRRGARPSPSTPSRALTAVLTLRPSRAR
jgi:hypothetical protein